MDLSPKEIVTWLKEHPDFLTHYPEACDYLLPPRGPSGDGVIDFQHYMVKRLKADKDSVIESTRGLIDMARSNSSNLERIHRSVLNLLEATSFADFIERITIDIPAILDVDIAALIVEADGQKIPHISVGGIRIVPAGTLDQWMDGKPVILQSDISGIEAIYGGGAGLVCSQALVRIDITNDTPPAMIAFGSRDPHLFAPGQATDLVSFLARVVERLFRSWLARSQA